MRHTFGNFLLVAIGLVFAFAGAAWLIGFVRNCVFNLGACV